MPEKVSKSKAIICRRELKPTEKMLHAQNFAGCWYKKQDLITIQCLS